MRLVISAAVALFVSAASATERPKSIGECAQFLPAGKEYSYKIEGTVVRTEKGATLKDTINVSGIHTFTAPANYKDTPEESAKHSAEFGKEIAPFQQCITALLEGH